MSREIILASASPRRKQLLSSCGVTFRIEVSGIDEVRQPEETPQAMAERLALSKARDIAKRFPQAWTIGADTDVSIDGDILGKPRDAADAARMLRKIQGREHSVWGAFALVQPETKVAHVVSHETIVLMAPMNQSDIESYVASGEPMDKAGAYAIQGKAAPYIKEIHGDYNNVVGLPLARICMELKKKGFYPSDFS